MSLTIDITGVPPEGLVFAASPLAELTAALHVLAAPGHHPRHADWAARTWRGLDPGLAEALSEAEFLWRSSRADFLLPAAPQPTLRQELDLLDEVDDETYVRTALITTCGSNRLLHRAPSPLRDADARERALDLVQARGPRQAAFAEALLADPPKVRARVRALLEACGPAFFDRLWQRLKPVLDADLRTKRDLLARRGAAEALAAVSRSVRLDAAHHRIVVDALQDNRASAEGGSVTFLPTVLGAPHLLTVRAAGWQPVVQYPVAEGTAAATEPPAALDAVAARLEALAHPVRLRLVRTLARGGRTTGELASSWDLTAPEVSRHLAVLRRAGLVTGFRRGRYVVHELDADTTAALGTDLLAALLR